MISLREVLDRSGVFRPIPGLSGMSWDMPEGVRVRRSMSVVSEGCWPVLAVAGNFRETYCGSGVRFCRVDKPIIGVG